jgi:ribosomal protein S27AE
MSKQTSKMVCPKCGGSMNHHADKLIDPRTPEDAKHVQSAMGGMIEETHCCPACGAVASRIAETVRT